jgi:hypothetical protein
LGRLAQRHFGIGAAEDAEAFGRIEQAVRGVVAELAGDAGEEEGVGDRQIGVDSREISP